MSTPKKLVTAEMQTIWPFFCCSGVPPCIDYLASYCGNELHHRQLAVGMHAQLRWQTRREFPWGRRWLSRLVWPWTIGGLSLQSCWGTSKEPQIPVVATGTSQQQMSNICNKKQETNCPSWSTWTWKELLLEGLGDQHSSATDQKTTTTQWQ